MNSIYFLYSKPQSLFCTLPGLKLNCILLEKFNYWTDSSDSRMTADSYSIKIGLHPTKDGHSFLVSFKTHFLFCEDSSEVGSFGVPLILNIDLNIQFGHFED